MPIKKEHQVLFERHRIKCNIVFKDALDPDDWPTNHRNVFQSIEDIKSFKYGTYSTAQGSQDDIEARPWRGQARGYARRLTQRAKDFDWLQKLHGNRSVPPTVRSEVEVNVDGNSDAALNLRRRQVNRDRCHCPRSSRPDDEDERVRLNKLFIHRAEDRVEHPIELANVLPQGLYPDRIYGLRQTRNLEDLLLMPLSDGRLLESLLQSQPHSGGGESMLFPFMVVEARAGKAAYEWDTILRDTAFPIYTYLNAQKGLIIANAQRSRWTAGPLNIVQAWYGDIRNPDDALQLFLLVDYMADWARDAYRPAILTELKLLASANGHAGTSQTDTDIYSSRNALPAINDSQASVEESPDYFGVQEAFQKFDSKHGFVRHISPIKSRFLSMFVTADTLMTFNSSLPNGDRVSSIRKILKILYSNEPKPTLLGMDELNDIEKCWTGQSRVGMSYRFQGIKFYTVHQITYYMSASWEQIRDLTIVSIAENALETLVSLSGLKNRRLQTPPRQVDRNSGCSLIERLRLLQATSAQQILLATISRFAGYIDVTANLAQSPWPCRKSGDVYLWQLVNNVYKYHTRGELEPDLPFLHISSSHQMQRVNSQSHHSATLNTVQQSLVVSTSGAVLIYGSPSAPQDERKAPDLCAYIVHGSTQTLPNSLDLARIVQSTFEDCDVYHTTRGSGTWNLRLKWLHRNANWNIKRSYGVFVPIGGASFGRWFQWMSIRAPERQGSPRVGQDTAALIFLRNFTPWVDPRPFHPEGGEEALRTYTRRRGKLLYKLLKTEVVELARISQTRLGHGITCCVLCAERFEDRPILLKDKPAYWAMGKVKGLCISCVDGLKGRSQAGLSSQHRGFILDVLTRELIAMGTATTQDFTFLNDTYIISPEPLSPQPVKLGCLTSGSDSAGESDSASDESLAGLATNADELPDEPGLHANEQSDKEEMGDGCVRYGKVFGWIQWDVNSILDDSAEDEDWSDSELESDCILDDCNCTKEDSDDDMSDQQTLQPPTNETKSRGIQLEWINWDVNTMFELLKEDNLSSSTWERWSTSSLEDYD
ncbi:hypothetical protein F5Y08DRAFT_350089 [Xylaria arbuscula]|nr:hypothetical protein F5Y08DRAFT_350089 [Xylaria arbuscula]